MLLQSVGHLATQHATSGGAHGNILEMVKKKFEHSLNYQVFLLFFSSTKKLHVAFPM